MEGKVRGGRKQKEKKKSPEHELGPSREAEMKEGEDDSPTTPGRRGRERYRRQAPQVRQVVEVQVAAQR